MPRGRAVPSAVTSGPPRAWVVPGVAQSASSNRAYAIDTSRRGHSARRERGTPSADLYGDAVLRQVNPAGFVQLRRCDTAVAERPRQGGHGEVLQHHRVVDRDAETRAQPTGHPHRGQRVPTEGEEVVLHTDRPVSQNRLPAV